MAKNGKSTLFFFGDDIFIYGCFFPIVMLVFQGCILGLSSFHPLPRMQSWPPRCLHIFQATGLRNKSSFQYHYWGQNNIYYVFLNLRHFGWDIIFMGWWRWWRWRHSHRLHPPETQHNGIRMLKRWTLLNVFGMMNIHLDPGISRISGCLAVYGSSRSRWTKSG